MNDVESTSSRSAAAPATAAPRGLSGQRAVVTGGGGGLGSVIAAALSEDGATVVVADNDLAKAGEVARAIVDRGGAAEACGLDVASEQSWIEAVSGPGDGAVDILVNAAGILLRDTLESVTERSWITAMSVNVLGATLGMKICAPMMRAAGRGSIVNIGSTAGLQAHSDPVYCASKWAIRGLSKTAALELASWGIRVNCVHPGLIPTNLTSNAGEDHVAAALKSSPLGRLADADGVAAAVSFLVGAGASAITGTDLVVDSGYTVGGAAWARRFQPAPLEPGCKSMTLMLDKAT